MKTKHTPGPWTVTDVANEQWNGPGYWVAHLDLGPHRSEAAWPDASATVSPCLGLAGQPVSKETIEANARLIAAAPDMLEALETLLHEADMTTDGEDNPKSVPTFVNWKTGLRAAAAKARAAVAKATKEKP